MITNSKDERCHCYICLSGKALSSTMSAKKEESDEIKVIWRDNNINHSVIVKFRKSYLLRKIVRPKG